MSEWGGNVEILLACANRDKGSVCVCMAMLSTYLPPIYLPTYNYNYLTHLYMCPSMHHLSLSLHLLFSPN